MKKLLFVLAFAFISSQSMSQIYLVTLSDYNTGNCSTNPYELTLTKVTPTGVQTQTCIPKHISNGALISLNQELNSIISQGYKLIETNNGTHSGLDGNYSVITPGNGLINGGSLNLGTSWYFAIP